MRFYHNPRCSKSRQALALLEERSVEVDIIRYIEVGIVEEDLQVLAQLDGIIRKKEAGAEAMRKLQTEADIIELLK
ncbi:MAG: arsenate reductase (glutaredoxin), partial [Poseidonia sp.]